MIISSLQNVDRPQNHIIAYLDMLGTTSKIDKDDDYPYLRRLYNIYNNVIQIIQDKSSLTSRYDKIIIKVFSDNIIMAIPLKSKNDIEAIHNLIQFTAVFQSLSTIHYCWPIRGGITIGDLFLDEMMVWGKGLIRAYNLENKIAIFPRIVVDQNIIQIIGQNNIYVRRDVDGCFFVDFLNFNHVDDEQEKDNFVKFLWNRFEKQLEEIRNQDGNYQERPYQKLQWYKNYLEQRCNVNSTFSVNTELINESTLQKSDNTPK